MSIIYVMKRFGSLILAFSFLLSAAGLGFGAAKANKRADAMGAVTLYLETPLSVKDSQALRRLENGVGFTAWGELQDVTITDQDLGRQIQTSVLALDGSAELVLPMAPVLPEGDTNGCLIGEKTAWELFGSTRVTGEKILIENETRIIRGVVNLPQSGVVLGVSAKGIAGTGADEETPYYSRITVESGKVADAEAFLMQGGLNGKVLRMDYLRSLHWLTELVPGKWSDFPGWKDSFTQKKQDFRLIMQTDRNSVELYYEHQCFLYMWDTGLEAVCIIGMLVCFFWKKLVAVVVRGH